MESYSISDKMERIIKVNGNRIKNMEKVFILGLMEAFMRETTKMVWGMDTGTWNMQMEMNTKENGKMDKNTGKGNLSLKIKMWMVFGKKES